MPPLLCHRPLVVRGYQGRRRQLHGARPRCRAVPVPASSCADIVQMTAEEIEACRTDGSVRNVAAHSRCNSVSEKASPKRSTRSTSVFGISAGDKSLATAPQSSSRPLRNHINVPPASGVFSPLSVRSLPLDPEGIDISLHPPHRYRSRYDQPALRKGAMLRCKDKPSGRIAYSNGLMPEPITRETDPSSGCSISPAPTSR